MEVAIFFLVLLMLLGIFLLIKGIRQGDEVDQYNTSGKMYIGMAVFAMVLSIGLSTFCFVKGAELKNNHGSSNSSYNSNSGSSNYGGGSNYGGSSSSGSFSNKYGTRTTKCYISGCNNYIAKSGDTNCCTTHSNKCLECRCYIDSDAMYCMSCLTSAAGGSSSKSKECYICGDSAYSKYGSYYYCSDCLDLVKAFSD